MILNITIAYVLDSRFNQTYRVISKIIFIMFINMDWGWFDEKKR